MIVSAETLIAMDEFKDMDKDSLTMKLEAIENLIRAYTNNNFQNRNMRIDAAIEDGIVCGKCPYFAEGDTVQISQSMVNDGLYVIEEITEQGFTVDKPVYDQEANTITKVIYPPDIQKGVVDLMAWEKDQRSKVGVKSETISRYSVTYYDQDANNQVMGYPVSLLGFLEPYMKPRF